MTHTKLIGGSEKTAKHDLEKIRSAREVIKSVNEAQERLRAKKRSTDIK